MASSISFAETSLPAGGDAGAAEGGGEVAGEPSEAIYAIMLALMLVP